MLPIVQRELQVAARSRNFYAWRLRTGIVVVILSLGVILLTQGGLQSSRANGIFQTFCFLALLYCLIEGLRKTSDAISEEKREGTLGLLFLTDLSGLDVILGKLTAAAVRSFNTLLACVPLLAICLLLGGTTGGEFWRSVLVLLASLAASLSLCVMTSTFSRDKSLLSAGILVFVICFLPIAIGALLGAPAGERVSALSPIRLLNAGWDASYRVAPDVYWVGLMSMASVSCLAISSASLVVPHCWQERPRLRSGRVQRRLSPRGLQKRHQLLDRNPAMWLMFDPHRQAWLHGFVLTVAIGAVAAAGFIHFVLPSWNITLPEETHLAIIGFAAVFVVLAAYLYVARESSRNLAEARQNGALELVLSTPLGVDAIIEGQILALTRTLVLPTVVLGIFCVYVFTFAAIHQEVSMVLFLFKTVIESVLGIITLAWFGMWMALTAKGATRAYLKTIAIGMILPHMVCTPTIVNQIVLLMIAADKVKVHFRRYVADRYLAAQSAGLSPVSPPPIQAPPVLR